MRVTADRLGQALVGRELVRSELRWPSAGGVDLTGRTVSEVTAYGKHLLMRFDDGRTLHTHLRMEGSWRVARTGSHEAAARSPHVRAVLANEWWTCIGDRLGMLDVLRTHDENTILGRLGPDLLADDFLPAPSPPPSPSPSSDRATAAPRPDSAPSGLEIAVRRLREADAVGGFYRERHPDEGLPVADALLSQHGVAGIGTIYAAEGLFARRLWPWTAVRHIELLDELLTAARTLMARSVQYGIGSQPRSVHGRLGAPCRRCGTPIAVRMANKPPYERPIFYCPTCQAP